MHSSSNSQPFSFHSVFESLEDRVLFDGVPDATFILPQADSSEPVPAQVQSIQDSESQIPRELVLIDGGVENGEQLLASILESKPNSSLEIRVLDSGQDGINQITQLLADSNGQYDAIHIISHGEEGEIFLGNTSLNSSNLNQYVSQLAQWSSALNADADILIYGCDLAGNAEGEQFLTSISAVTGADVAASDDLTGAADKGGDWDLEFSTGYIASASLAAHSYVGTLAVADSTLSIISSGTPTWDANNDAGNDTDGVNNIIRSHDTIAMEVFYNTDSNGATDLNFTSILPEGLVWDYVPAAAALDSRTMIFDSVTGLEGGDMRGMLAYLPDVNGTFTSSVSFEARALGGEQGTALDDVYFEVNSTETPSAIVTDSFDFVLSSAANMDIRLYSPNFRGVFLDPTGTSRGVVYTYGIGILGDHPTRTGSDAVKGSAPIEDDFTFDLDLSEVTPGARIFDWGASLGTATEHALDGIYRNYERFTNSNGTVTTAWSSSARPAGQTDEAGSTAWTEEHSTPDSGDWNIVGSSGPVFTAQVSGANTSGTHFPDFGGGNTVIPAADKWFSSAMVAVWIPVDEILPGEDGISGTPDDGLLQVTPEITNFDPDDAYGVTNNFGTGIEDTSNNDVRHTVYAFNLGGSTKYNSEAGHPTSGRWLDTASYWNAGDAETSVGHQYDARVSSGQNAGVLALDGIIYGDKFDNSATKVAANSLQSRSGDGWSRTYISGGSNSGQFLTYGVDYIIEFGTGGVDAAAGGWTDWDSMGDANLGDDQSIGGYWSEDPTDLLLGGNAYADGVRDSITKWRVTLLRDLEPGETLITLVTMETVGHSTLDLGINPGGNIIANFNASSVGYLRDDANPDNDWRGSEYDPLNNSFYAGGSGGHVARGDRLWIVDANVDVDKTVVDLGAGNNYLAGSAATIQLEATVTIPGPDTGSPAQDVYITDMLPPGLTVVGGSAQPAAGFTYTAGDGSTISVQAVEYYSPDTNSWSTNWTYGATGIRWYFGDVPLNTVLPTMTFDVLIPFDAENGESWTNTAVGSSPSDDSSEEFRSSSAGLVAVQVAAMSAGKFVVTPLVAEDSTIIYELGIANISDDKDVPWFDLVDLLPYDADFEGSSFSGVYTDIAVTGLDPGLEVYVTSVAATVLDAQDGTVDGYADPGTPSDSWYVLEDTGIWSYTLDDVINGVVGAPTIGDITGIRVVSDKGITPYLAPGESTKFFLELTPDGNVGIPSDHYTNKFAARTAPSALPLPVTSAAVTAVVIAPDIEIEKEVAIDETHTNIDPTDDSHWTETVNFDDTDKAYFRLKVTNTGTADFLGATVTDNLPVGATFVAGTASANAGDFSGFPATWTFDLAAGDSAYLIYQIDVDDAGSYLNSATVDATDQFGESVDDTDDAQANFVTEIAAAKQQTGAIRSIANPELFEVSYEVEIMNTSIFDLANLTLNEDLFAAFGPGYMGLATLPDITFSTLSVGATAPSLNFGFDGNDNGTGDAEILNGDGLLKPTDSVTITYTVLVNPLLLADPANTVNQVSVSGETGGPGGTPVTDLSDDGDDPTSDNPGSRGSDGMGGTDDPTPLILPAIDLTKEIVGSPVPANSGTNGNYDVTYEFTISNSGTTDLDNLSMIEDFLANFGNAFVDVTNGPRIIFTDATDNPDFNSDYDGGVLDPNIFQNVPNTDTFTYGGSNSTTTGRALYTGDQSIVIDPNQTYTLSADAFAGDGAGGSFDSLARHYLGFISYDIDGNTISPYHYTRLTGATDTTLAAALNPGDTTITLTDATGWQNAGATYQRTLAWYGYTDSTGHTYADYDYTRNILANAWDSGSISGNTITLRTPWAGPALAAGDAIRNATSGGSYQYSLLSAGAIPQTTTNYSTQIGGGFIQDGQLATTMFRPGTHSISSLVLADWLNGGTGTQLNVSNFQLEAPNTNLLEPGQQLTFQITVEIDPDAPGAIYDNISGDGNNSLENQASITAEDPWNGVSVDDTSDDPFDLNDTENGGDSDPDDPTSLIIADIELTKSLVGTPTPANSGTFGNYDAIYDLTITNIGNDDLESLSLTEDFADQFGGAFVQIVSQSGAPVTIQSSDASNPVEINSLYNGDNVTEIFDNTSGNINLLEMGQSITVRVIVEVAPHDAGANYINGQLLNLAMTAGTGVETGNRVDDESDDTNNPTDSDPDGNNSPDDPTPLIVPDVSIAKSIVGDPVQIDGGNFVVQYQFVVRNMGTTFLANLQVIEDFAAEFGANVFVQTIAAPVISIDPTNPDSTAPTRSLTYDGSTDSNLLDGISGLLAPGDSFAIGVTVELDPNAAGAILPFENTAVVEGDAAEPDGTVMTDGSGNPITVTDDSDSGTDPASDNSGAPGDNGAGGTDDPTPLFIADLDIAKAIIGSPTLLANGNHKINYSVIVENTGTVDLANLSLIEDLEAQFGSAFQNVSNLALTAGPGAGSTISLATTNWDGTTANSELIDNSGGSLLAIGDAFTIEFCVEVDASELQASTTPTVYTNEAAFAAGTGATLREDFSDVVGNTPVTLPFTSTLGGVQITGSVISALPTATELREDANSFTGGAPDDGVFAIRQSTGGSATLRITVPNPGNSIGFVWADVFDPAGGAPAGEWTYFKATASDGTVLFEHDERTDGDLPSNFSRFVGIQGTGSQTYTHIDIDYETSGNDNWTIDHIYDSGNANDIVTNQVLGNAEAVDDSGNPINDSNGDPITVTDESDSGTTPDDSNSGEPGDTGGADDPTPLYIPSIGLAKQAGDAVANGDNFDITFTFFVENTGNVDLNNLTLMDDIETEFDNAFVSISGLAVQNFSGTGTAPTANAAWMADTSQSMVSGGQANVDDTFEVVFTVTINPDGIDSVSQTLENQGTVGGDALDENGDPLLDGGGTQIVVTDDSDNGTDANGENGEDDGDGVFGDDPTPVIIADISVVKEVYLQPIALANDNFSVTYQLLIENTGTVDLDSLSLLEDLKTQFGAAYVSAGNLTMITPPSVSSSITLDSGMWNGDTTTEMISQVVPTSLVIGDSFIVRFDVEIDPDATGTSGALSNQVTVAGNAVDSSGNPILDSNGTPITADDDSDSGSDPSSTNSGEPGDTGGSDDPTPLLLPALGVAKQANSVIGAVDGSGAELNGAFDIEYLVVIENTGTIELTNLQLTDDLTQLPHFGDAYDPTVLSSPSDRSGLVVGPAIVSHTMANAGDLPTLNAGFLGGGVQTGLFDGLSGTLQAGEQIVVSFTVRIDRFEFDDGDPTDANGVAPGNQVTGTADSTEGSVTDDSDNGLNPNTDNGGGAGTDDFTPFEVPQIRLWKSHSDAVANPDGTSTFTVSLRVQNSGTVDLSNLSLTEDIATQFGQAFISTTIPTLDATNAPTSTIPAGLINTGWASDTSLNMFDPSVTTEMLASGEELTIIFDVTVDPDLTDDDSDYLTNTANVVGDGQNYDGSTVTVSDDSGIDNGTGVDSDEPVSAVVPEIVIAKSAGDAVANGDNWDVTFTLVVENNGSINLDMLTLYDDISTQFGDAYAGVTGLAIQNFAGAGTPPTANSGWMTNTSLNMLSGGTMNPGDRFEVVFTVTIDPDGVDAVSDPLNNQATVGGRAVDELGNPLTDTSGDPLLASDDSDSGTDPQGTNGGENGDTGSSNDPTPIIIADVSIAKETVGPATLLSSGNFEVVYQLVVENVGTTNLANLTLIDDLETQFGPSVFQGISGLTMITAPTGGSSVALNTSGWDGTGATDIIDTTASNLLEIGDSFVIQFTVEIDAVAASTHLDNTATTGGTAVDDSGTQYTDSSGNPITTTDDSDSGADPNSGNPGEPGDDGMGGTDDPTPLYIPNVGLAKTAGDAVANGDNFDVTFTLVFENTGTVDLTNLTMLDDIEDQFGDAYVSVSGLIVQSFTGTGTPPTANAAWMTDTSLSLITGGTANIDDTFEVVFTVTIDPDRVDNVSQSLNNQATTSGEALDENGLPLTDGAGDPITATDTSDDGTDPTSENGDDNGDGTFGNDPTPIIIADISVVKAVVGTPTPLDNGNFNVVYELVVENTGTVDLANLTLIEDILPQFGSVFVGAGGLTLQTSPTDPNSIVLLDSTNWDGEFTTEMIDQMAVTLLAVGDSFAVRFTVEVDPDAANAPANIENQVVTGGDAVDSSGAPINDSSGNQITTTDDSDSGTDPNGNNPTDQGDNGTSDDATPLLIPDIGIAKSAGDAVANGDNWDVTFTILVENTGTVTLDNLSLIDDIRSEFGDAFLATSGVTIQNLVGSGTLPTANNVWETNSAANMLVGGSLDVDSSFEVVFTVTIDPDGIDSLSQGLMNQATATGDGVNPDGSPMTDESGDPVTATDDSDNGVNANDENGSEDTTDGVAGNDPTPIVIADIGLAKSVVGQPTLLSNGNHEVTYQLVVENIGTVDLANLSLLEDLATQFGAGYVDAGSITITVPPSGLNSTVTLDLNWDGSALTEMVDGTAASLLEVGDSFTLEFKVEVVASELPAAPATNTVSTTADAVDENGDPIEDSNGDPITASDDSDSGTDPSTSNIGEPGDTFGSDDPTPLYIPSIGLAKSAGDAVANGDNWDVVFTLLFENNGSVDLDNLTMFDDIASQFGDAFVDVSNLAVQNFVGTGTAPIVNGNWEDNTTQTMISGGMANVGDTFEVIFTVTVDPDASSDPGGLDNQAIANGNALDENGDPIEDSSGNPITTTDASDNGTNPNDENGDEESTDGVYANDPTPMQIADLAIAKSIAGTPELLFSGNYVVTYQLVIENTGTLDLASLSLLENLPVQFGPAFVDAGNLTITSPPTDPSSSITVDSAGWNGNAVTEMMDISAMNILAVGDSFTVEFAVEINPDLVTGVLENQVAAEADAVDENGVPVTDSNGDPIVASDLSDSGTDAGTSNPTDPGDNGTSDDPSPFDPPPRPLGEISGTVFIDNDNDGIQDSGEEGIEGVEITLVGEDVFGNPVNITVLTDSTGRYTFPDLPAGNYQLLETQPDGFDDGLDNGNSAWTASNDGFSDIVLEWGQVFGTSTFAERLQGASGNPANLPPLSPLSGIRNSILGGYLGGPGPIYSGIPINGNSNPLSLESGRPVQGGYSTEGESDCGCPETIEPVVEELDACGQPLVWTNLPEQQIAEEDSCCEGEAIPDSQMMSIETAPSVIETEGLQDGQVTEQVEEAAIPIPEVTLGKPSFLKRMATWLNV